MPLPPHHHALAAGLERHDHQREQQERRHRHESEGKPLHRGAGGNRMASLASLAPQRAHFSLAVRALKFREPYALESS